MVIIREGAERLPLFLLVLLSALRCITRMEPIPTGVNSDSISPAVINTNEKPTKLDKLVSQYALRCSRMRGQKNLHQWHMERLDRLLADAVECRNHALVCTSKGKDTSAEAYMKNALLCLKGQALSQIKA